MIPSLEGWPTKAKEAPSPHEVRLAPVDTKPVFQCLVFRIVRSVGVSSACFGFFISSCSSFIFRLYLSLFLMYEFYNFLDRQLHCLLYLLVGLSKRSFSCMFGLLLWPVLLVYVVSLLVFYYLVTYRHKLLSLGFRFCQLYLSL